MLSVLQRIKLRPVLTVTAQRGIANAGKPISSKTSTQEQPNTQDSYNTRNVLKASDIIDPLEEYDSFGVRNLVSVRQLMTARVHLGHKTGTQNPLMRPYIFGNRLGQDIIDLDQTVHLLGDALNIAAHIAFRKGVILFVSRMKQTIPIVERAAVECGEYAHCRKFILGTFTNQELFFGLESRMPDLVILLSTHDNLFGESIALEESAQMNIPTIGILDTNCDPRLVTYPVPGNDDTPQAVKLYCDAFKRAILKGKAKRKQLDAILDKEEQRIKEEARQERTLADSTTDADEVEQKQKMSS